MAPSVRSTALPTASSISFSSRATRWRSHGETTDDNDDDSDDELAHNVRLSDNHLLQLALEATQALDWTTLARPPAASASQAAWRAVKIKQPATALARTQVHTRVQGERIEAAAHTVVPCSLLELTLVLEATSSAQFCDTMRLVHGDALVSAELVHAVDTGTAATSELLVSAVTFNKKPRNYKKDKSHSLFSAWRQDDAWCFLDFVQRISPRVVRKTLLSLPQSRLLVGKASPVKRPSSSQQQKHDVLAGYLFEELDDGRSTRISFWGEHTLEQSGASGSSSSGVLSRAIANRAGKARILRLAESIDRYILVVRRRRLGMQVMADEIKVLASNSSCVCCSRSFLLARKRTCNLCGYYVCDKCSRLEERERRASLSSESQLAVTHVRICEKCIARVDSCVYDNVALEDLGPSRVAADSPLVTPSRAHTTAPSTGALLMDLLQGTLASVPEGGRSPVLSVIKHLVSLESPTASNTVVDVEGQRPMRFTLTKESSDQEHLEALHSRFADVPRLSLPECKLANAETRSYLIEHGEDPNGTHPYPVPDYEQRRLDIVRGGKLTELEGIRELDVICELVSKELECMGALVSISEADTFRAVATNIDASLLPPSRTFPRSEGFCSRTMMGVDPLLLLRPEADVRFNYILPVKHMKIAFYCGFPIFAEDYTVIGSLCCLGHESHQLTQSQFTVGKKLAEAASRILQQQVKLRRASRASSS